jgi:transposase
MPQPAKGIGTGTKPKTAPIAKPPIERHSTRFTYALKQWTVERCFNKLKHFRRLAARYDRRAVHVLGFLCLAAAMLWMR